MGRLSDVVQAVEFEIDGEGERAVRCLISAEVLQERFGADAHPGSWLVAYERHRPEIVEAARTRRRASTTLVILNERSFD